MQRVIPVALAAGTHARPTAWRRCLLIAVILLFAGAGMTRAQEAGSEAAEAAEVGSDLSIVYVTVQQNASLRAGPGTNWERLAVIPFGTTWRATGRTLNGSWLQVAYTGERENDLYPEATIEGVTYGWIASRLLFWTGSILELPVDGVPTVDFARAAGTVVLITPETQLWTGLVGPTSRVSYPLEGSAYVEATGRLGNYPFFWVQIKARGVFYWVSSVQVGYPGANLLDASYLYASGRLNITIRRNLNRLNTIITDVGGRWRALAQGEAVTCNNVPPDFGLIRASESDLQREPVYAALDAAFADAEAAATRVLERFRGVCSNPAAPVTANDITAALSDIDEAERLINFAALLAEPLRARDPFTTQ